MSHLEDKEAVYAALPCGELITSDSFAGLQAELGVDISPKRFRRAVESLGYDGKETNNHRVGLWRPYVRGSRSRRKVEVMRFAP